MIAVLFCLNIIVGVLANQIIINEAKTYFAILKHPVFGVSIIIYIVTNQFLGKYGKSEKESMEVDNEMKIYDAWCDTQIGLMKETLNKVRNNDLSGANNTLDVLEKLNKTIERGKWNAKSKS